MSYHNSHNIDIAQNTLLEDYNPVTTILQQWKSYNNKAGISEKRHKSVQGPGLSSKTGWDAQDRSFESFPQSDADPSDHLNEKDALQMKKTYPVL